jgi:hypothetical protein
MKQLISKAKRGDKGFFIRALYWFVSPFMPVLVPVAFSVFGPWNGNNIGYLVKHFAHMYCS